MLMQDAWVIEWEVVGIPDKEYRDAKSGGEPVHTCKLRGGVAAVQHLREDGNRCVQAQGGQGKEGTEVWV